MDFCRRCVVFQPRTLSLNRWLCTTAMSKEDLDAYFAPPSSVRGVVALDKRLFKREIQLPAVKLQEASLCNKFINHLSHVILKYPFLKKVVNVSGEDGKVCYAPVSRVKVCGMIIQCIVWAV